MKSDLALRALPMCQLPQLIFIGVSSWQVGLLLKILQVSKLEMLDGLGYDGASLHGSRLRTHTLLNLWNVGWWQSLQSVHVR